MRNLYAVSNKIFLLRWKKWISTLFINLKMTKTQYARILLIYIPGYHKMEEVTVPFIRILIPLAPSTAFKGAPTYSSVIDKQKICSETTRLYAPLVASDPKFNKPKPLKLPGIKTLTKRA